MSARGTANFLTRTTAVLAVCFFATSILLAILSSNNNNESSSIADEIIESDSKTKDNSSPSIPTED